MSRNKKIEKDQNPPPKSIKPKGLMKLMRSTFIDEIIRKEESQALVGPRTISRKMNSYNLEISQFVVHFTFWVCITYER